MKQNRKLKALPIGTKSVLFGVHNPLIHSLFLATAWIRLYGFRSPKDIHLNRKIAIWEPGLWACFILHDLGYIGKPDMDGPKGEQHIELGALWVSRMFDKNHTCENTACHDGIVYQTSEYMQKQGIPFDVTLCTFCAGTGKSNRWYRFCKYHSRFIAKQNGTEPSLLCYADKLAVALEPAWLYLLRAILSGELREYMALTESGKYDKQGITVKSKTAWFNDYKKWTRKFVNGQNDLRPENARWNYLDSKPRYK